jgi:hypothetical protein
VHRDAAGLYKLIPVVTHSLKPPGEWKAVCWRYPRYKPDKSAYISTTLEPIKWYPGFKPLVSHSTCTATPRLAAARAFAKDKRSMVTTDIIPELGPVMDQLFPCTWTAAAALALGWSECDAEFFWFFFARADERWTFLDFTVV